MKDCCKNQTTPYCGECGANLQTNSLVGLKEYLEKRLTGARERLATWKTGDANRVTQKQGIARNTKTVEQLECWIREVGKVIAPPPKELPRT